MDASGLLWNLLDIYGNDVYIADVASTASPSQTDEPTRDKHAGRLLQEWRLDRGLSPETLSWELRRKNLESVTGRQIRRIEQVGVIPTPRVMFALASFFGVRVTDIWRHKTSSRTGRTA